MRRNASSKYVSHQGGRGLGAAAPWSEAGPLTQVPSVGRGPGEAVVRLPAAELAGFAPEALPRAAYREANGHRVAAATVVEPVAGVAARAGWVAAVLPRGVPVALPWIRDQLRREGRRQGQLAPVVDPVRVRIVPILPRAAR